MNPEEHRAQLSGKNTLAAILVHTRFIRLLHGEPEQPRSLWRKAPGRRR